MGAGYLVRGPRAVVGAPQLWSWAQNNGGLTLLCGGKGVVPNCSSCYCILGPSHWPWRMGLQQHPYPVSCLWGGETSVRAMGVIGCSDHDIHLTELQHHSHPSPLPLLPSDSLWHGGHWWPTHDTWTPPGCRGYMGLPPPKKTRTRLPHAHAPVLMLLELIGWSATINPTQCLPWVYMARYLAQSGLWMCAHDPTAGPMVISGIQRAQQGCCHGGCVHLGHWAPMGVARRWPIPVRHSVFQLGSVGSLFQFDPPP